MMLHCSLLYHFLTRVCCSHKLFCCCICVWCWISVAGDHVLVGSYDRKLSWFDLDLSNKPYQMLKYVWDVTFY